MTKALRDVMARSMFDTDKVGAALAAIGFVSPAPAKAGKQKR